MNYKRRVPALVLGSTVLAATALGGVSATAAADMENDATYRVTIANLASGQPLTPPLVVLHGAEAALVEAGAPASEALQQLAENGNPQVFVDSLEGAQGIASVTVADHPIVAGGIPGAADVPSVATIEVNGPATGGLISVASMLICTNDGFSIVHDAPLPAEVGQIATFYSDAYDAGTEVNTESFADLVPPCQGLVGVSGEAEGTGASNPELAEGGVVAPHAGIAGEADLDAMSHAVASNPALVVVERIS
jgi:hypothetical protein